MTWHAMTSEVELFRHVRGLLLAETALFGSSAERAVLLRRDELIASVNPHAPDRSMFNWVVPETPEALRQGYAAVADAYQAAGVRAWTVWLNPGEELTERWLAERGHTLDGRPRAMAADLSELSLAPTTGLEWQETRDFSLAAAINDDAYGFPPPAFRAALSGCDDSRWRAYLGLQNGRFVSSVLTFEAEDGNCGVSGVATLPEARGRGIASRLLSVALDAAHTRGCRTTSLQASRKGAPTYARLGYRDLGAMSMWEHRVPAPAPSAA
ncbi:MAG TPA: GNAT family N-acetyltransferase [Polyangiaceae bacterium]